MVIASSMPVQDSLSPMKALQIYYVYSHAWNCLKMLKSIHFIHCLKISAQEGCLEPIFVASISNFIFDLGLASNVEYAKTTAMNIIDSFVYVPFLAVLALSNVLGFSIQLYTKSLIDQRLMALYNNLIHPFEKDPSGNGPVYLFWGSTTGSDQLDHFVPLLNESDFELLPEQDPVENVELEPLDLKFLENIFIQFGHKNKLLDFSDNVETSQ